MSILMFNLNGHVAKAVKNDNDLYVNRGDIDSVYKANNLVRTVSDEDYRAVINLRRDAELVDGNIVYTDIPWGPGGTDLTEETIRKEEYAEIKEDVINRCTHFLEIHQEKLATEQFTDLRERLEAYLAAVEALDLDTLTFPTQQRWCEYWEDNQSTEFFPRRYFL
tara:strand:- start:2640 stop:3134 length:495 start_codon:yes stop_codon:yes gene_type:complete